MRAGRAVAALAAAAWVSACAAGGTAPGPGGATPGSAEQVAERGAEGDSARAAEPAPQETGGARTPASARARGEGARTFVFECGEEGGPGPSAAAGRAERQEPVAEAGTPALRFTARIEGETAWLFLPGQTVSLPHVVSASGAKYSDGEVLFWSKGEGALLEWRGERHSGCRNDRRAAVWEHAKLNGVDFRAVGQEPGWHLEIRRADSLVLVSDYGTARFAFPWAEPVVDRRAETTTFLSREGGDELRVQLELGTCYDTMSGERFATRVTVWINGRRLDGCGRPLH